MKYFFVVAVITTVFSGVKSQEHNHSPPLKEAELYCANETNISLDVLTKAEKGEFPVPENNLNCFAECLFKKVGFLQPGSDELQIEMMKNTAREKGGEKYVAIVDLCSKKRGANLCETTYQVYKCYNEEVNKPENKPDNYAANSGAVTSAPGDNSAPAASGEAINGGDVPAPEPASLPAVGILAGLSPRGSGPIPEPGVPARLPGPAPQGPDAAPTGPAAPAAPVAPAAPGAAPAVPAGPAAVDDSTR